MSLTERLLLLSVLVIARCAVCRRRHCDAWLWGPDDRTLTTIHARCLRAS